MRNLALTTSPQPAYTCHAFAKSKASREKLSKVKANSTPTRAFFVRTFCTPKENHLAIIRSMMACSGQSLRLASFPLLLVSHPATRYRQTVRSSAIAFNQFSKGLLAMIYKFLLLGEKRLKIAILANSEQEARQRLNLPRDKAAFIARIKGASYA
ncbi:ash family protein [Avibacterium paragallinarum]|uniref:ash family protein n=1 Tax=Avibacterium paragallinarum TaxID=728 RepID=UPI00397D3898